MLDFQKDGLRLFAGACAEADMRAIECALEGHVDKGAGVRLHAVRGLAQPLRVGGCIGQVAGELLGTGARPVRAILFDKTATTNWALGWHQDRTIVVKERTEVSGFGPWTVKGGLLHVAPPIEIVQAMVTLRLHLDDVDSANAPLLAAEGSHLLGRVAQGDVAAIVERSTIRCCLARRGDIWVYSTPILHASDAAQNPRRRRVLQVDYASLPLPGGLEWLGV